MLHIPGGLARPLSWRVLGVEVGWWLPKAREKKEQMLHPEHHHPLTSTQARGRRAMAPGAGAWLLLPDTHHAFTWPTLIMHSS